LTVYNNTFILGAHASAQKITETTKSLKICYVFTLIVFVLRSYVDELKWRINSEWATLGRALLNVLLASRINVHCLRSC